MIRSFLISLGAFLVSQLAWAQNDKIMIEGRVFPVKISKVLKQKSLFIEIENKEYYKSCGLSVWTIFFNAQSRMVAMQTTYTEVYPFETAPFIFLQIEELKISEKLDFYADDAFYRFGSVDFGNFEQKTFVQENRRSFHRLAELFPDHYRDYSTYPLFFSTSTSIYTRNAKNSWYDLINLPSVSTSEGGNEASAKFAVCSLEGKMHFRKVVGRLAEESGIPLHIGPDGLSDRQLEEFLTLLQKFRSNE